ncbi:hypothetical protein OS493_020432 [Desmophyllum pertusum]|uniref:Uncharacterized protein n=1 Tax=Desmophyllum pertusum TaxID=174260 RepID=A0A9W9ZES6_9CNID|nr:hypothetical protein OS493_020432 [Desmophyllum pertusum]
MCELLVGGGDRSKRPQWFGGGEEAAKEIRNQVEKARHDELKHWENDAKATLALILLQDQFLRSLYKGSPIATSRDPYCQELSLKPQCVQLFEQLEKDCKGGQDESTAKGWHQFAILHKDVVDKFGRFPQRNKVLGRDKHARRTGMVRQLT